MEDTKICKKCGRELPISEFSKCKNNKDGLQVHCKECQAERKKQWYCDNREKILEYQRMYNTSNADYYKQYRKEHKHKVSRGKAKQYNKKYKETLRGYCANIRKDNVVQDRKYGRIGDELPPNYPTIEDYMKLLQQVDFYDEKQYDFSEMGLDRIDNSKPHTLDNVVPCTTKHNRERGRIPFDVFCSKFDK